MIEPEKYSVVKKENLIEENSIDKETYRDIVSTGSQ